MVFKKRYLTVLLALSTSTIIITIAFLTSLPSLQTPITQSPIEQFIDEQPKQAIHPAHPICTFITPPSGDWSYNSRSFCRYPRACLSTDTLHIPSETPTCQLVNTNLRRHSDQHQFPCTEHWDSLITCAYTPGLIRNAPTCALPQPLPEVQPTVTEAVFVPRYPYPANIYHYANVITTLAHILSLHPTQNLTIIFNSKPNKNPWQASFFEITLDRIRQTHQNLKIHYLHSGETICANHVLLLGTRGHVNVWPFPNTTAINHLARELPVDTIAFRKSFYQPYGIPARLPDGKNLVIGTPPLVLGYAKRLGPGASTGGNVHAIGTIRRFSDLDEIWFQQMLRAETAHFGVDLRIFTTTAEDSLQDQVTNFATLGAVIGIHGANLVNSIFMPPLSALIEVFPANVSSQCYYAGGNAGLRYFRFDSNDPATPEESGCTSGRCMVLSRQRMVKISRYEERIRLRDVVRQGLTYLVEIHRRYPYGVPVREDTNTGMYKVVE